MYICIYIYTIRAASEITIDKQKIHNRRYKILFWDCKIDKINKECLTQLNNSYNKTNIENRNDQKDFLNMYVTSMFYVLCAAYFPGMASKSLHTKSFLNIFHYNYPIPIKFGLQNLVFFWNELDLPTKNNTYWYQIW